MSGRWKPKERRGRCTWCGVETGNHARHMRRGRCAFWRHLNEPVTTPDPNEGNPT